MRRRVDPEAKYFACFDATSGFHQIRVCEESSKLMTIVTQYGTYRYTVLGQGICSSQDLFNWITDGGTKLDEDFQVLKNIDDFCLFAKTLPELEKQIDKLAKLCEKINLKLSPSKFTLSTAVKFGGEHHLCREDCRQLHHLLGSSRQQHPRCHRNGET